MKTRCYVICILFFYLAQHVTAQKNQVNQPVKNFDLLWKAFDNHYAFFSLKQVDWSGSYKKYRARVTEKTNNDSLFDICSRMLAELKDGHVSLSTNTAHFCAGLPANLLNNSLDSILKLIDITDSDLIKLGFKNIVQVKGQVGEKKINIIEFSTTPDYGYMRVNAMSGLSCSQLKNTLRSALNRFSGLKGVIIDVRFNGGGYDDYSYEIAGHFTDKKRIGHYKHQRKITGHDDFTPLKTWFLTPRGKKQYTGPVVVLTSNVSASATDVFALAMRQLPYVTILGDTTYGVFSDQYESRLPDGWHFTLSYERYYDVEMKCYEGVGIRPDILLQNSLRDLSAGKDPVIYKAVEILKLR